MHKPDIFEQLSTDQRKAVMHGEGPILVTAGPGSGKTHVLTSRILYLIQERQIPPDQILVITFTREAARSMQSRFFSMQKAFPMPSDIRSGHVSFGTFHSFFYQILRSSEKYTHYHILQETEKQKLLYPLLREIRSRPKEEMSRYFDPVSGEEISRILSAISYGKNTGRETEASGLLPEPWRSAYEEIRQSYERQKKQRRQLDLDDLLTLTFRELQQDGELLRYWRSRYTYILLDEFQDCNPLQYEIVKMLYTEKGNVFAVGDDDQAIYGFRGAQPGIMQRFLEEYADTVSVVLGKNYRCAPAVVEASAKVIACNLQRVDKELVSARTQEQGKVELRGFAGGREERQYVLSQCRDLPAEELNRFAVLFRTNSLLGAFTAELLQAGIPFVIREPVSSIYGHFVARDVMDYFRAAYGARERQIFLRIWNRPRLHIGRESLTEEQVDFNRIRQFYTQAPYQNPAAVRDVEQFARKLEQLRRFPLELGVTFIRRGFGYEEYLSRKAGQNRELLENWLEVLDWLSQDSRVHASFAEWERYQNSVQTQTAQESSLKQPRKKGIHVMTMHAAKGLEFDRVFLMDINEGTVPKLKRGEPVREELLEEERRLLYVGMTRARECLEILYRTGTSERPRQPSSFLRPLLP